MKSYFKIRFILQIFLLLFLFLQGIIAQSYDLTGTWRDNNGTTYILRHVGDKLFWNMDGRPSVHNVFYGSIADDRISGEWADLPDGQKRGNGTLVLDIESNNRFVKVSQSANYGASVWTRVGASNYPSLAGVWYAFFPEHGIKNAECQVIQQGDNLVFINEKGARSNGSFESETSVIAKDWGNLKGSLTNKATIPGTIESEFTKIEWANGSYWIRYIE